MFLHVVLIGLLAFGYSTFVRGETDYTYYDYRIDSVSFSVEGNVDEECAHATYLSLDEIQLRSNQELDDDVGFSKNGWNYIACLALKRELVFSDGSMKENNVKVLQNDMNVLGYFDESLINRVITQCPNNPWCTKELKDNPNWNSRERASTHMMYLTRCLYKKIKEFYLEPRKGDSRLREQIIQKAKERSKKAVKLIIFKEKLPDTSVVYTPDDKEKFNAQIDANDYSLEDNLDENCMKQVPNGKSDIDFQTHNRLRMKMYLDSSTSKYLTCLALKRNLMNSNGTMNKTNIHNLRNDIESFGCFHESVVSDIIGTCPKTEFSDEISVEDRLYDQLYHLSGCIFERMRVFYKRLVNGEPYSRPVMWNFTRRAERATNLILFKLKDDEFDPYVF